MMMNRRLGAAGVKRHAEAPSAAELKNGSSLCRDEDVGRKPSSNPLSRGPPKGNVNYLVGRDQSKWRSNIPLFGQVSYRNLYPGIDLAFHGSGKQLEFDYLVNPGAKARNDRPGIQGCQSNEN